MCHFWMLLFLLVIYQVLFALSSRRLVGFNVKGNMRSEEDSLFLRDDAGVHQFPWMPSRIHRENEQADASPSFSGRGIGDWTLGRNTLREALANFHAAGLSSWISLRNKYLRGLNKWASRSWIGSDSPGGNPPVSGYNWTSEGKLIYIGGGKSTPGGNIHDKGGTGGRTTEGKVVNEGGIGVWTTEGEVVNEGEIDAWTTEGKVVKVVNEGGIAEWAVGGKPVQQNEKKSKNIMDIIAGLFNG